MSSIALSEALELHELRDSDLTQWEKNYLLESTQKLVDKYGKDWVRDHRVRLKWELGQIFGKPDW